MTKPLAGTAGHELAPIMGRSAVAKAPYRDSHPPRATTCGVVPVGVVTCSAAATCGHNARGGPTDQVAVRGGTASPQRLPFEGSSARSWAEEAAG
ncbi:hypothetical protein GW17_00044505 [Ensete ventricosum]|nr:hypothetical protein GW17_00044505 [Ensete ventricosum]